MLIRDYPYLFSPIFLFKADSFINTNYFALYFNNLSLHAYTNSRSY
jgi:hypothetical protein